MTLYLLNFNNYYNRIVKRYDTIDEYLNASNVIGYYPGINFNPNDGISTKQIINYTDEEGRIPDYILIVSDDNEIVSRWFVIEAKRNRAMQFEMDLYRDVIADWYNEIISAPCFIEKAQVGIYDSAIFNNEDMTFNQIKTSEKLIKDKSGCGWYVGYIAKNTPETSVSIASSTSKIANTYDKFEDYPFNKYVDDNYYGPGYNFTFISYYYGSATSGYHAQGWDKYGNPRKPTKGANQFDTLIDTNIDGVVEFEIGSGGAKVGYRKDPLRSFAKVASEYRDLISKNSIDWESGVEGILPRVENTPIEVLSEIGKVYQIGDKFYEIQLDFNTDIKSITNISSSDSFGQKFVSLASQNEYLTSERNNPISAVEYSRQVFRLKYVETSQYSYEFSLSANRSHTDDSPYDIFIIPYGYLFFEPSFDESTTSSNKDLSKRLVDALIPALGSNLYDIQIFPYAPLEDNLIEYNITGSRLLTSEFPTDSKTHFQKIGEGDTKTVIIYPTKSNFVKTIAESSLIMPSDPISFKVSNECDLYRIVSPNYNGQFEFSLTKNGGVSSWNISFVCKPYTPYIRVSPEFGRLYGKDFEDARGLICGGDFSMTQIEDLWKNYEIQNKNYQVMFDRQIQNLEVNNAVQRTREIVTAIAGTAQGATSAAMFGMISGGGPVAAAAAGVVGGAASAAAGIADVFLNESLRKEALDFTKDQFGYQLQNIQALPYSLTKVGSQNSDFKIFPFLEYYSCTEEEKQALRNKIKYNGMTVMRIGNIEEYLKPEKSYIKGKLIRIESIADDYHVINMISKELNEGVYI